MSTANANFSTKLNQAVYSGQEAVINKKTITMEDIAKCKGSSQSLPAMALNQLIFMWKTKSGPLTDSRVKDVLLKNGVENAEKISNVFKEASTINGSKIFHEPQLSKQEQKMTADLAKIFDRVTSKAIAKTSQSDSSEALRKIQQKAEKVHIGIGARQQLEKYNPMDLLRAAAFDGKLEKSGVKRDFIHFLSQQPLIHDEGELRGAYKAFIEKRMDEFNTYPSAFRSKMEEYSKGTATQPYHTLLALESSGMMQGLDTKKVKDMALKELLKPVYEERSTIYSKKINQVIAREPGALQGLIEDKEGRSLLIAIAKISMDDENINFLSAVTDAKKLSEGPEKSAAIQTILAQFVPIEKELDFQSSTTTPINIADDKRAALLTKLDANPNDISAFDDVYTAITTLASQLSISNIEQVMSRFANSGIIS